MMRFFGVKQVGLILVLGLSLLLAACGGNTPANNPPATTTRSGIADDNQQNAATTISTGLAEATVNKAVQDAATAGAPYKLPKINVQPCTLFTKDDFAAVMGEPSSEPNQIGDTCELSAKPDGPLPVSVTFNYDHEYSSKTEFDQLYQVSTKDLHYNTVTGVGDSAYWADLNDSASIHFLQGSHGFSAELWSVDVDYFTPQQKADKLKTVAQRILTRFANPQANIPAPTSQPKPTSTPAPVSKSPAYDACKLLTKADFAAVLGETAAEPDKSEDDAEFMCSYQAANSDSGSELNLMIEKEPYTLTNFNNTYKTQEYSTVNPVTIVGDAAYWTQGAVSRIYVLKGSVAFIIELTTNDDESDSQLLDKLQTAANKVLFRLK